MRMTKRRPRSRALASVLAAAALLTGALIAAQGSASATSAHTAAARTPTKASPGGGTLAAAPITSPATNQVFTPGSNVKLQAVPFEASDAIKDGLSSSPVTSISFYASTNLTNNRLVAVAKSAPWTVQWKNVPAGDYSLTAVTKDAAGQTTTSDPVAIQVEKPSVVTDQSSLAVAKGNTGSFSVSLSTKPAKDVTVRLNRSGGTGIKVSRGETLTFTPSNWNKPQQVTVAAAKSTAKPGAHSTLTASAAGLGSASVGVTDAATATGYDQWFLNLYAQITNTANGYFSPLGIPYHSVEELIVEAPDYGHETTSETYSYWLWLAADYGQVSGDWTEFNTAWSNMQTYMIPNAANQPGCSAYNASSPATYGPEEPSPSDYPVALNSSVPVGSDPLSAELTSTYGNCDIYAPMWIMDTDNRYGFGQQENGTSTPSFINTFQRGSEESVWDTVDQPDWDNLTEGESGSGYLALFNNGGGSFAAQYKYTDAPDADARLIQAAYWAQQYATAQGNESQISGTLADAAKLGDYLRYSMYDKYFKQISAACSQDGSVSCPAGTSKANEETYLLSWYYAWGGSTTGAWSWRISGTEIHEGYQNPLAAYALSTDSTLIPLSSSAKGDWTTSLTTQLNLMQWLQSSNGGIAGGVTNNWGGNYGDVSKPPSGDPTFDGMYYDFEPVYHNPPSNQWFGYQTWPMERVAEYYYVTGNAQAGAILSKWVSWAESVTSFNTTTGAFCLPGTLTWSGQPAESFTTGTSSSAEPPANPGLTVSVSGCAEDIGVASSLAKVYAYYAAKSGNTTAETDAQNIIDIVHQFYGDTLGYSAPESRTDYSNFTSVFNTTNYEGLYIPSGWSGTYPGISGDVTSADNTFLSIRPWYTSVADYNEVQAYLNGGSAPVFNYHRFWAEVEVATAFQSFAYLFPSVTPPASATPTVTVTNPGTQTGTVGTADNLQIAATDSATGKTFTYSSTDLPIGLTLNASTGAITGSPSEAGSYTTTVTVNDGTSASSVNFDWTIGASGTKNTVTVTNPGAQTGKVGTAVSLQIHATDSASGQTLTYAATSLPAGLSISSSTGLISGTPTTAGTSSVVVTVTDGTGASGTASFSWTISTATTNTVTVTNPGTQTGTVGTAASLQIHATDSASGQTLTYTASSLPAGLSISSTTGLISGTPTTAGTSSVTVTATDTTGASGTATFSWTINPAGGGGSCQVLYTPNNWQGGFTANIVINNTGTSAINGWTLKFTFPGDEKITNTWNGVESQSGEAVTITNESYNSTIAVNGNVTLGFQGTWTNSDAVPTAFTVNGATCTT
jgi:Glycosyl hydrolase family 48/Cellulose binding domain/Putative Ig domain